MMKPALLTAAVLFLAGCGSHVCDCPAQPGELVVSSDGVAVTDVTFPETTVGAEVTKSLVLRNVGRGGLYFEIVEINGSLMFAKDLGGPLEIPSGGEAAVQVTFRPSVTGMYTATWVPGDVRLCGATPGADRCADFFAGKIP